jgi:hypothetical protein
VGAEWESASAAFTNALNFSGSLPIRQELIEACQGIPFTPSNCAYRGLQRAKRRGEKILLPMQPMWRNGRYAATGRCSLPRGSCPEAGHSIRRLGGNLNSHLYEVRPRKDHRGVDLISDVLPFDRLWYGKPDAISDAIGYAKFYSRSHDAVIRVYDAAGSVIDTHEHARFQRKW